MLVSTRGFVLYQAEYSETSLIVKIFTEHFGMQSYIVKGVRKKGSRMKRNLFEPLSMLDIVGYRKENTGLHLLKEASCHRQFIHIPADIVKSSIVLFMNELLYRSIPGEMPDPHLFEFIYSSLLSLDEQETDLAPVPLRFALQLADLLGICPQNNFSPERPYFNLQDGVFCSHIPDTVHYMGMPLSGYLSGMLEEEEIVSSALDHTSRVILLEKVLEYFRLHLSTFGEMKSQQVLSIVLRD